MLKYFFAVMIFLGSTGIASSQTVNQPGKPDAGFPGTNNFRDFFDGSFLHEITSSVTSVQKANGRYLAGGDFSSVGFNEGSALLIDSASGIIFNNQKYRINGLVKAAIPDGQGGFYIAGEFTKIGDSSRHYIAQIDSNGVPGSWNLSADTVVSALEKRNDTLFIAGAFKNLGGKPRNCFALYSISGDSLCVAGGTGPFPNMSYIHCFILQQDTVIIGGKNPTSQRNIMKFNFRDNNLLSWQPGYIDYTEVKFLELSKDRTVLIYGGYYNGDWIKGAHNRWGNLLYSIKVTLYWPSEFLGYIRGLQLSGNKAYVVGAFEHLIKNGNIYFRKGFFVFDPITGSILDDNPVINGYPHFLKERDGKLIISGKFTLVNGVNRHNFAVIDTGSFAVGNWQLAPTDPVNVMQFQADRIFVSGRFTGINAVPRTYFASIDSAGKTVGSWAPPGLPVPQTKRMIVRGDSVFVMTHLGYRQRCSYQTSPNFKVYSLSTGAAYGAGGLNTALLEDMLIDGNYLYVATMNGLRRYLLPNINLDAGWGFSTQTSNLQYSLQQLISDGNKIYAAGDSRRFSCGSSVKRGYVGVYSKATGLPENLYNYVGLNPDYDHIYFDHVLKMGNKLFVQGEFTQLNDSIRRNFASIDLLTGKLTPWKANFVKPSGNSFQQTSDLKNYKGQIWFGSQGQEMNDGSMFRCFGAIDTTTGNIVSQPLDIKLLQPPAFVNPNAVVLDFFITDAELVVAGTFDTIQNVPVKNIAIFKLTGSNDAQLCNAGNSSFQSNITGSNYQWEMNDGSVYTDVINNGNFSGAQSSSLQLINIPSQWRNYQFRCRVNNNTYSDVFKLKFTNSWTGAISNAWENADNWSCGMVPDANTDVLIATGTAVISSNTIIGSIHISAGAAAVVGPGIQFTVLY
jgi:hypothetical protein